MSETAASYSSPTARAADDRFSPASDSGNGGGNPPITIQNNIPNYPEQGLISKLTNKLGPYAVGYAGTVLGGPFAGKKFYDDAKEEAEKRQQAEDLVRNAMLSGSQVFSVPGSFQQAYNKQYGIPNTTVNEPPFTGGDNEPIIPRFPIVAQAPTDVESTPSDFDLYAALEGREAMRFGQNPYGIMGAAQRFSEGGEVRQAYGLGKLVKKITKPIQKVVKSDLGKAALTAAAAYYAPALLGKSGYISGANPLFSATGKGGITDFLIKKGLGAKDYLRNLTGIGLPPGAKSTMSPTKRILTALGIGATVSPFFMGGEEEDEETLDQAISRAYGTSDLDIPGIRRAALGYSDPNELYFKLPSAYRLNAADGGRIGFERGGVSYSKSIMEEFRRNKIQGYPGTIEDYIIEFYGEEYLDPAAMAEGGITSMDVDDLPMSKEGSPKYYNPEGKEISFKEFEEAMKKEKQIMPKKKPSRTKKAEGGIASEDKVKILIKRGADNDLIKTYIEGISDSEIEQIRNMMRTDKAEGGLMNLGGNEMDLRGGGFVPIGAKEKADDVPARLSKNEFVFTADAVRAAGGGSIEKGAQKMYNTMKQLEKMV